jgi:TonB family protein
MPLPEGPARRRYARYHLAIPFDLTVFRPSAVTRLTGQAEDVGEGGLCGVISEPALPGERVELTLSLPSSPDLLNMRAVVRHQSGVHCGFEFLSLEHAHREQLQRLAGQPEWQSRLLNETEWEPGMAPLPRADLAVCAACGHELSEEIPVCLMCGAPQSPEASEETGKPQAVLAAQTPVPLARKEAKARRGPHLDSVVAIVFLVTLSVGLWQWMKTPKDADSESRPSPVTVTLENVFLRPAPARVSEASATARSRSSAVYSAVKSAVSAIIGSAFSDKSQATVGGPETSSRSSERENSAQYRSAPSLPSPPLTSPPPSSPAPNLLASSTPASVASTASASSSPSASALAGMLLQKVLPVYPEQARRQGVQGQVVLKAVIGKDGAIAELRPLEGPQELTAAAIDAVQHWRFRPYELKGQPVEVETNIRLNFQLPEKK